MIEEMSFLGKNLQIDINQVSRAAEYIENNNSLAGYPSQHYVLDRIIDNLKTIVLDEGITSIGCLGYYLVASDVDDETVHVEVMVDPSLADAKDEEETLDRVEADNSLAEAIEELAKKVDAHPIQDQLKYDQTGLTTKKEDNPFVISNEELDRVTFGSLGDITFGELGGNLVERIKALEESVTTEGQARYDMYSAMQSEIDANGVDIAELEREVRTIKRIINDLYEHQQGIVPVKFSDIL